MSAAGDDRRVVLVTGAGGNLGRAVAATFARGGDRLVLVERKLDSLHSTFGDDSDAQLLVAADLMVPTDAQRVADTAMQRFGRIDVLCNLAGGFRMGEAVHETSAATWDFLLDLNARTVLHMAHAVVPAMLQRGRGWIVNVGAASAARGLAQMGAYTASKAVVQRLTEAMAAELRERGVNVNCVLPTVLDTPENRRSMPDVDPARWVAPDDLAAVIAFLASDAARAVHGASVPVSGLS